MSFRYELKPPSNIEMERQSFRLKFCDDAWRYRAICQCTRLPYFVLGHRSPLVRAGDTRGSATTLHNDNPNKRIPAVI